MHGTAAFDPGPFPARYGVDAVDEGQVDGARGGQIHGDARHAINARFISEAEFHARTDLLRTLEVKPPVVDGRVRIVEIEGFDAQACGGTHVHHTGEVGRFSIFRTENKGRINKRLYVRLDQPA